MSEQAYFITMTVAQKILTERWGTSVQLIAADTIDSSTRSAIQRFQIIDGPADAPASIIVKRAVTDEGTNTVDFYDSNYFVTQRFWNEWAGLQFLEKVFDGAPPAPRLYGADRTTGIMVMEDLGHGSTLIELVQGNDPTLATMGLVELMTTLGRLNGQTIGKEEEYLRIRQALGLVPAYFSSAAEGLLPPLRITELFHAMLLKLGISAVTGIDRELTLVTKFWGEPGPFGAYIHGDPVPGNECKVGNERKLVDFEFGGYHHALAEGVYARIQFVTGFYVQRIPDTVALAMENAYRAELVKGCPQAGDDAIFYRAITEACAYATIAMWQWAMPSTLIEYEEWGLSSCRQRILRRLEILAETTMTFGHLEALGAMARKIREELCRRWPPEVQTMPYFPAFQANDELQGRLT